MIISATDRHRGKFLSYTLIYNYAANGTHPICNECVFCLLLFKSIVATDGYALWYCVFFDFYTFNIGPGIVWGLYFT